MAKVTFPARCAVSVVCGQHLISQVYPASVPIEVFIDDVVELLNEELIRRGVGGLDSELAYELNRVDGTGLDVRKTLDEMGVEDGTTLVLVPKADGDSFEPQYESLSTGLARVGKKLFEPVTAQTAARTALVILSIITVTIVGLTTRVRLHTDSIVPALTVGTIGLLAGLVAALVLRYWPKRADLFGGLAWPAVPLLAEAAAIAPPGDLGAPHLFIAALAVALLTCVLAALTNRNTVAANAIVTLCAIGATVAGVRMWSAASAQVLGMCTLIGTLVLVTVAPTIALWTARIRPPHFGSITGRDLFRRADGLPVDTVSPVDDDIEDELNPGTPRGAVISAAATRANGVLTGICIAVAIALPLAVWATLMPGRPRGNYAVALTVLFVVIFLSRGRAFADRWQAIAVVCGAAVAVCAGVTRYALAVSATSTVAALWGIGLLVTFAIAGLSAALLVPATRFTPLVRMVAEWLELVAIVAVLPLAAWTGGLFTWVRMR